MKSEVWQDSVGPEALRMILHDPPSSDPKGKRWRKELKLPTPRVRFFTIRTDASSASPVHAPSPLPEEMAATAFGLMEHRVKGGSSGAAAVEVVLRIRYRGAGLRGNEQAPLLVAQNGK